MLDTTVLDNDDVLNKILSSGPRLHFNVYLIYLLCNKLYFEVSISAIQLWRRGRADRNYGEENGNNLPMYIQYVERCCW